LDSFLADTLEASLGEDLITQTAVDSGPALNARHFADPDTRAEKLVYFILAVLGFSFWFFTVVPFASHRETYWWLAMVHSHDFSYAFGVISSTYRPLAQGTTWLAFKILDPNVFPTSVVHQAVLQGCIYGMFVLAWWLMYSAAPLRRIFAVIAFIVGGVFFSGYVHLFHIYGIFYIPVMLTSGALLRLYASNKVDKREVWFGLVAVLLAFWHPFATALFMGFYFGFCLDTFRQRSKAQLVQSLALLLACAFAIGALVVLFPRAPMPLHTRLFGFLVSYRTNEVNLIASAVAFVLTQLVVFTMAISTKLKLAGYLLVSALGAIFLLKGLPLILLWICAVLLKLLLMRRWSLFFLALTAALLPFGGGIGTPMYALFAIIVATYVTPLGLSGVETALSSLRIQYVVGAMIVLTVVMLMVRAGIKVPVITRVAKPLLAEREKTYQLENILAWLHNSDYCSDGIAFAEDAGDPIEGVESAITRKNRPPSWIGDVRLFWNTNLRCGTAAQSESKSNMAVVTFGGLPVADSKAVFKVAGKYTDDAVVWVADTKK
jgi:hypothetical protein